MSQVYIWKYGLSLVKFDIYNITACLLAGGDIADKGRHKLARMTR